MTQKKQHRAQKDTNRKELVELKSENKNLKKQIGRLKKQLSQTLSDSELAAQEADWKVEEEEIEEPKTTGKRCPKCESTDIGTWQTPLGKILLGCRTCKRWRGVA